MNLSGQRFARPDAGVTLTEVLDSWVKDAERMHGGAAEGVVVTSELFAHLVKEQDHDPPVVAGLRVLTAATEAPSDGQRPAFNEMVEIAGPDRVSIYVGMDPEASAFPLGLDPAMPVVFVPVPPSTLDSPAALEMYNRLRWYGLDPTEAFRGSGQA